MLLVTSLESVYPWLARPVLLNRNNSSCSYSDHYIWPMQCWVNAPLHTDKRWPHSAAWGLCAVRLQNFELVSRLLRYLNAVVAPFHVCLLSALPHASFLQTTFPRLPNSSDRVHLKEITGGHKGEAKVFLSNWSFSLCFRGMGIF